MSVFADTGVFDAHHDTDASRRAVGVTALDRVLRSAEHGRVTTSDYVYDEVVTLTHRRTGRVADAVGVGRRIRGDGYPDAVELLHSSSALFDDAVGTYGRYDDHGFGFTDAMTVATVEHHDVDAVLSFEDGVDGVVGRLVPESLADR
jgi:hypothetical protein